MTDAELIAQLREYREINEGSTGVSYDPIPECLAAADRIELLATTNEQLVATLEHEVRLREAALAALIEVGKTE